METVTTHKVGIILNGVTGRMGTNQHLMRSIMAIMRAGRRQARRVRGDRARPDPRRPQCGEAGEALRETGGVRWTTNLDEPLADPRYSIYFDAQTTDRRVAAVDPGHRRRQARLLREADGDHHGRGAWSFTGSPGQAGVKNGVVQDKLWLPGLLKLKLLRDTGFFGQILSVRGEFGYWVFEGDTVPAQRPSWNYRKEDGGGIIIDMLCHFRYVLGQSFRRGEGRFVPGRDAHRPPLGRKRPALRLHGRRRRLRHV